MLFTLAIVGRPNVGKSTLFNRLAGKRLAIVHDTPGVTRDRRVADARAADFAFQIVDTAGFETGAPETLAARMTEQTRVAIGDADVCLFVIDAREGVTGGDEIIAETLRRSGKPVILATNKNEGRSGEAGTLDSYRLGFGEPIAISAEHALGIDALIEALRPFAGDETEAVYDDEDAEDVEANAEDEVAEGEDGDVEGEDEDLTKRPLRLAIVGRPNVGKSSLFNRLLGEERSLTGPEAGITRDAIAAEWVIDGRTILLHDTAGMRKKARVRGEELEELSVGNTLNAIIFADCVIVLIDATMPFEKQDLSIADLIEREGRAIVFVVNKWDLIENRGGAISNLREKLDRLLPQVAGAPLIAISAATGEGIDRILPAVMEADRAWNTRASTAVLNRFLQDVLSKHPPPAIHGRRVRIRYMTQAKSRPPTFAVFGNQIKALPASYLRYLTNSLRAAFNLQGTPIRFSLRQSKNPFENK
jgi:GTP-binding protein